MAKEKKYEKDLQYLLYLTLVVLIILLSIFNLQNTSLNKIKVLGSKVEIETNEKEKENNFWREFQTRNPTYIDGWIELGRLDKVKEIDPNYFSN